MAVCDRMSSGMAWGVRQTQLKGESVKKLTLTMAMVVFAAAAFLVVSPQTLVGAVCCSTCGVNSCTVQLIATGQQFTHGCVPNQNAVICPDCGECQCPYIIGNGWGHSYRLINNGCPGNYGTP